MPHFSEDQYVDVEMNIDVDEFYEEMDESEKKEMARLLRKGGYEVGPEIESKSVDGHDFQEALRKLAAAYYSLSNEDIHPIIQLAKRF